MANERIMRRRERRGQHGSTPAPSADNVPSFNPAVAHGGGRQKSGDALTMLKSDVRALNSAIAIISQKMKHLVRNEKILGRNLVVLNKKMQKGNFGGTTSTTGTVDTEAIEGLKKQLERQTEQIQGFSSQLAELKTTLASHEELMELRHVIDSINPLEFVTRDDVKELIEKALEGKKASVKHK